MYFLKDPITLYQEFGWLGHHEKNGVSRATFFAPAAALVGWLCPKCTRSRDLERAGITNLESQRSHIHGIFPPLLLLGGAHKVLGHVSRLSAGICYIMESPITVRKASETFQDKQKGF